MPLAVHGNLLFSELQLERLQLDGMLLKEPIQ